MLDFITQGLFQVFQPVNFIIMCIGVFAGIIFGAIPGLTATLAISLLIPFTFGMPPIPSLVLLLGIYCGGIYGGSITAILIRAPGTPGAAATVLDGYPLTKKGKGGEAVGVATIASGFGGLLSAIIMIFLSPQISKVALQFSGPEYFALAIFGLSIIFSISGKNVVKGMISGLLGLIFGTVGMDLIMPLPRFTFGQPSLMTGMPLLPAVIGLFALAEVFRMVESTEVMGKITEKINRIVPEWKDLKKLGSIFVKSSIIGTFIGALPGAGANIASFVSYNEAKRMSKNPEEFGTGIYEGVAASEAANNAVTGGALIPMLTLGIPGDAVTAVLLSALTIQGYQPGPLLFKEHMNIVYPIFAAMIMANIIMVIQGLTGARFIAKIASVPKTYLVPAIAIFAIVGAFASSGNIFDIWVTIFFGLLGYILEKYEFPVAPIALAIILGPLAEVSLRQSLIFSKGDPMILINRPISGVLIVIAILSVVTTIIKQKRTEKRLLQMAEKK